MRRYIPVLVALLACGPAAAQTYRWVDEHGVTNYGPKPPAGRASQLVDTRSRNTIDTGELPKHSEPYPAAQPPTAPVPAPVAEPARGMDFDIYIRLTRGMSEGELVSRAGKPDYVSWDAASQGLVKSFYYYPTRGAPFITVVTVRGGRIDNIERTKKN